MTYQPLRITFAALEESQCRFPFDAVEGEDGPFVFCGQDRKLNSSYCEHCHRLCWVKPNAPKKPYVVSVMRRFAA